VYTPTKDVVKSFSLPSKDVFSFDKELDKPIKLSFFSGSKLLNCLSHFDPHHLSADISYFEDESEGTFYADKITFKDQKLKIDVYCQDISLGFTSMTDDQVKRAFDRSSEEFAFSISREDLNKVNSLMTMEILFLSYEASLVLMNLSSSPKARMELTPLSAWLKSLKIGLREIDSRRWISVDERTKYLST
jgi:hypothetical protein